MDKLNFEDVRIHQAWKDFASFILDRKEHPSDEQMKQYIEERRKRKVTPPEVLQVMDSYRLGLVSLSLVTSDKRNSGV